MARVSTFGCRQKDETGGTQANGPVCKLTALRRRRTGRSMDFGHTPVRLGHATCGPGETRHPPTAFPCFHNIRIQLAGAKVVDRG